MENGKGEILIGKQIKFFVVDRHHFLSVLTFQF
jgi:hypothetical protein